MTRLERNRQQAVLIIARIERNLELSRCARVGQFIRAGQESKRSFQRLIRDFQPKKETANV
jgi:hypothetical protein